ncbi:MAG: sensor domain-containing diguanylate cyclase [Desulfobacterales bacterium]|jgi:diguanylate cyclase (GGDEF)-like protein|nr:sensor domain-containing diguanylate cyclase [Desulfobacterales bacterium]
MVSNGNSHDGALEPILNGKGDTYSALEAVQTGIVGIDGNRRILMANRAAIVFLGIADAETLIGRTCYGVFLQADSPCGDCPISTLRNFSSFQKAISKTTGNGDDCFLKEYVCPWGENYILTLNNVTREIGALRKTDLARKEFQAKNVLIERHRREAVEEKHKLGRLLDYLPDAVVLVNAEFYIDRKNSAVAEHLPVGRADTCYGLIGLRTPCAHCPAKDGFHNANGKKTNHLIDGRYLTEIIIESPENDGGVLLFRDATRQIQLIEKIREQQETITRKNNILSNMVNFGTMMQKENNPENVADFFLNMIMPVCHADAAALIINDIRPGSLWFTVRRNFAENQMLQLIRASLSERNGKFEVKSVLRNHGFAKDIQQIEILGGDGRCVGIGFLVAEADNDNRDLISLFYEPLGAYLHNRILMRRLEERANTDPLTGLYNRGYLDTILSEEEKKHKQYDIPYAVVVADVNRLKQANDQYGHEAGDALIIAVARSLQAATRDMDCVARTGGDEFVILLSNTTDAGAQQVIARFVTTVFNGVTIDVGDGETFPVAVSFGACGVDAMVPEALLKEADRRMYAAKEAYYQTHQRYR